MAEIKDGCVKPVKGPIATDVETLSASPTNEKEVKMVQARVGKPAPDFELTAFHKGGFKNYAI